MAAICVWLQLYLHACIHAQHPVPNFSTHHHLALRVSATFAAFALLRTPKITLAPALASAAACRERTGTQLLDCVTTPQSQDAQAPPHSHPQPPGPARWLRLSLAPPCPPIAQGQEHKDWSAPWLLLYVCPAAGCFAVHFGRLWLESLGLNLPMHNLQLQNPGQPHILCLLLADWPVTGAHQWPAASA